MELGDGRSTVMIVYHLFEVFVNNTNMVFLYKNDIKRVWKVLENK